MLLVWSGCAEARVVLTVYSEATPVKAQAIRIGAWTRQVMLDGVRRQLSHFVRGTLTIQKESRWELRLTRERDNVRRDLPVHPEDGWVAWVYVVRNRAPARVAIRLLGAPATRGGTVVSASLAANLGVGDTVVHDHIDLESVAREIGRARPLRRGRPHTEQRVSDCFSPAQCRKGRPTSSKVIAARKALHLTDFSVYCRRRVLSELGTVFHALGELGRPRHQLGQVREGLLHAQLGRVVTNSVRATQ